MNLLRDAWIPLAGSGPFRHASLKDVLCGKDDGHLRLSRDDMELAALQLASCLTQVLLPPADARELRERAERPLASDVYDRAAAAMPDWFDLRHPKHPFMQTRGVKAKEATPIQKLFVGLPAGNNHAFFLSANEVVAACPSCAAVALFNQASNAPSFGGGFIFPIRGTVAVTTLAGGRSLRETIWLNVLHRQSIEKLLSGERGEPTWVAPIRKKERIPVSAIGFLRGLFWQPAHIELRWESEAAECSVCGEDGAASCSEFKTEKFPFEIDSKIAQWPHPHGPRQWEKVKGGKRVERFVSFRRSAPAWTQLSGFLMEHSRAENEGWNPAPVISQYRDAFRGRRLDMIVGGYKNKQAKILERRHELFSLARGWDENQEHVRDFIERALEIKDLLRKKSYGFGKKAGLDGMGGLSEERFYAATEGTLHDLLRDMHWDQVGPAERRWTRDLCDLAMRIFDELARPYRRQPKLMKSYVLARRSLEQELACLRREE